MKNFLKILILPIAVVMMLGFAPRAFAVDPMTVVFAPNPIFGAVLNFLPGDSKDGDATVTNNTDTSQNVYAESVNGFDPDGLGSQLRLRVLEGANVLYDNVFSNFLSAGPVSLSSLGAGNSTTYTFKVSFIDSEDNDSQGKTLGFGLCIGFSGGTFQCGDTVISDPESPIPPDGNGNGGGGGGGGQFLNLIIFNESALVTYSGTPVGTPDGIADVTWQTNLLSTSQVVYGLASGSYPLDLNSPTFGYPSITAENPLKVINHSVTLTDLIQGQTYVYRVISRASPPTISPEYSFTLAQSSQSAGPLGGSTGSGGGGEVLGASIGGEVGGNEEMGTSSPMTEIEALLANVIFSGSDLTCLGVALIIFFILLALSWFIFKNKQNKSYKKELLFMLLSAIIISIILLLIPYTCPLIPLWIIVAIYVIWKLWTERMSQKGNQGL